MITWIWTSRLSIKNFLTVVRQVAVAERPSMKRCRIASEPHNLFNVSSEPHNLFQVAVAERGNIKVVLVAATNTGLLSYFKIDPAALPQVPHTSSSSLLSLQVLEGPRALS